jgi:negative regulator of PHO system
VSPFLPIAPSPNPSTDLIGQGAYGTVYRGTQRSTNRTVAIKRIPYADSTPEGGVPCNVIREISLLRELTHDNVVQLLDVIQATPGGLYLVFEFVAHDLKTYMDQRQRSDDIRERIGLPKPTVRSFMRQILNGVGYCHTHRVLHRDLKPHNVSSVRRLTGNVWTTTMTMTTTTTIVDENELFLFDGICCCGGM